MGVKIYFTSFYNRELAKAEEDYEQISKKPEDESTAGDAVQTESDAGNDEKNDGEIDTAARMNLLPGVIPGQWKITDYPDTSEVKISLEKFKPMQHAKPALSTEHIQPEKFNRQFPPETMTDS